MEKYIPYGRQWIDEEDIREVAQILRSDFLTTGPKVEAFERAFADFVGAKYAVAIANGTAALHAACHVAGIGSGDEVITTPMTFAGTANSILYCGGTPVFADILPDTYNIDPEDIERKITKKTRAILPVHYTGQPCDMDEIRQIARKYNLIVIEDAAHGLGATYKGRKIGSISELTTFSLHPVKHITTGEGGMITTNDESLYEKLKLFRSHGITRESSLLDNKNEGSWYYEQLSLGYNYRLTDIQSALGLSQLQKLPDFLARRREIASRYHEAFKNIEALQIPYQKDYVQSAWHIYVIRIKENKGAKNRREVFEYLKSKGLGVNVHYIPVYYFPYYQSLGYQRGLCPVAEEHYQEIITLPLYPAMEENDVTRVIDLLKEAYGC